MLFAEQVVTEKVVLELIAFFSLLATNIFSMWQNKKHAKHRTADIAEIKKEIAECKGELCKPK